MGTDEEDVDEERRIVLKHVTTSMCSSVEVGNIGAHAFQMDDKKKSEAGYYLVEFVKRPKTKQKNGQLTVDCHWLNPVPGARCWYTRS